MPAKIVLAIPFNKIVYDSRGFYLNLFTKGVVKETGIIPARSSPGSLLIG